MMPDAGPGRPARRHGPIAWLLLRASGVDPLIAQSCGEERRYEIYGGLVLFTTTMAMISLAWAVSIATSAPPAVVVTAAAIWGFGIFHIDQWLVSSHLESDGIGRRLWLLVPRLAIAVPMGLTIAWFAMLGIASKEINQQLAIGRIAQVTGVDESLRSGTRQELAALTTQRQQFQYAVDRARKTADEREKSYNDERSGRGGTRRPGPGPIATGKLALWQRAEVEYQRALNQANTQMPKIDRQISSLQDRIDKQRDTTAKVIDHNDGLFARRAALDSVLGHDPGARRLYLLLEVVFVVVDVVPAIAKTFSPASEVDLYYRERKTDNAAQAAADGESPDVADARRYAAQRKGDRIRMTADTGSRYNVPAARNGHRRGKTPVRWRPY